MALQLKLNAYIKFIKEVNIMPRNKPQIYIETAPISFDGTEANLRYWVRATEILLRAKARQQARLPEFQTAANSLKTSQMFLLDNSASLTFGQ